MLKPIQAIQINIGSKNRLYPKRHDSVRWIKDHRGPIDVIPVQLKADIFTPKVFESAMKKILVLGFRFCKWRHKCGGFLAILVHVNWPKSTGPTAGQKYFAQIL